MERARHPALAVESAAARLRIASWHRACARRNALARGREQWEDAVVDLLSRAAAISAMASLMACGGATAHRATATASGAAAAARPSATNQTVLNPSAPVPTPAHLLPTRIVTA